MAVKLTEKDVFFALCKGMRKKQDGSSKGREGHSVDTSEIGHALLIKYDCKCEDINGKQIWAILHKLIAKGLVVKKKVKMRTKRQGWKEYDYFELGTKGKQYIETLKNKKGVA